MAPPKAKLSAVMANRVPFFGGKPVSFFEAHPEVSKISLIIQEHSMAEKFEPQQYDETDEIPAVIDCSNDLCSGGGFHLAPLLSEKMILERNENDLVEIDETIGCVGFEGKAKSKFRRDCRHCFTIKARIEFSRVKPNN